MLSQLNNQLTKIEFNQAINNLILHKATSLIEVSPNAVKALDGENRNV